MSFFVADGVRLAYRLDGLKDRPPLVMINSLGTGLRMWDFQVGKLGQKLCVLRLDSRGHGASAVPDGGYSIERLGLDVLVLLDMLEIKRVHVCGLSLGGMVAQWLAIRHPERVEKVVLANTAARIGSEEIWDMRIAAVETGGMASIQEAVMARFLSQKFRSEHPEITEKIGQMVGATNPVGYIEACKALRAADFRKEVASILAPVLVIGGEVDESTPVGQVRELHQEIKGSQLVVFPEVAHLSNVERPEEFSELVLRFLA